VPSAPGHHVAAPPPHERPSWDSGDGMGRFTHWSHPGGGASSSGISTATARKLPASAGSYCAPTAASDRASAAAGSC
jgi:hypothetical protein